VSGAFLLVLNESAHELSECVRAEDLMQRLVDHAIGIIGEGAEGNLWGGAVAEYCVLLIATGTGGDLHCEPIHDG
jgi:hypothetical protein